MIRAGIIGASGYSGAELMKILFRHPGVSLERVFANTSAGKKVEEIYPLFQKQTDLVFQQYGPETASDLDLMFIALPSGEAMNIVPPLLQNGKRVVDLGGDFRLRDAPTYEKFYKHNHVATEFLQRSVYGLPELNRKQITTATLLANPGCYPTSAILALLPALCHEVIAPTGIIINSLSGVSGAGRNASLELSFVEVNETVRAYKIGVHQHIPEIKSVLEQTTGKQIGLTFVPHLIPISRGIYTTAYGQLCNNPTEEEILDLYESYYQNAPFVRVMRSSVPEIKNVLDTNYCDVAVRIDKDNQRLIVISVLDNLVKGASGQAVQNMNIMFGFPEEEGLLA